MGPKGSGKTFIGNVIERYFDIKYINAEKILLHHIRNNPSIDLPLPRHGFEIEICEIRNSFIKNDSLVYDMTGTSEYTNSVIDELKNLYHLHLIQISCSLTCCMERIKSRSVTDHFIMDIESIDEINNRAINVRLNWAGLFHSKQVFECVKTKASETLGLGHILPALVAI